MRYERTILFIVALLMWQITVAVSANVLKAAEPPEETTPLALDEILNRIEKRYSGAGFTADFYQESTLKEMDITDRASGKIVVKHPGKMRWEYEKPEKQLIITDSEKLWIYRPEDNQVMIGEAPAYFGGGKGVNFLSDMKSVRKNFSIRLQLIDPDQYYILKLEPVQKKVDITEIFLSVSMKTFDIEKIVSYNSYGDRTQIYLSRLDFERVVDDSLFSFSIPKGTDVLQLDR